MLSKQCQKLTTAPPQLVACSDHRRLHFISLYCQLLPSDLYLLPFLNNKTGKVVREIRKNRETKVLLLWDFRHDVCRVTQYFNFFLLTVGIHTHQQVGKQNINKNLHYNACATSKPHKFCENSQRENTLVNVLFRDLTIDLVSSNKTAASRVACKTTAYLTFAFSSRK